jgi:hypothetical protein
VLEALEQLVRMLDALAPARLDPHRSSINDRGHGWTAPNTVGVRLAHTSDETADVSIALEPKSAIVEWLETHEHVFPEDGGADRPWTTVVADVVAAALRGEYEVELHYRGDRLVKTRLVGAARDGLVLSTTGSLVGWLRRGPVRVETRRLDYGLQSSTEG